MSKRPKQTKQVLRKLDDGLLMRRATAQDGQALADFNASIFPNRDEGEDPELIRAWTLDLLTRPHPTFLPEDYILVEDTRSGKVVSALNLISQTWSYEGIPFKVGRPELVGTHPEYRERGLIRAQFEEIHRLSAKKGQVVQAITGIPYYYRLFGYEMALSLGGGRLGYPPHVPRLPDGEVEPFRVRPAGEADLAFISELYEIANQRYPLSCLRDLEDWRYELAGKLPKNVNRSELRVIEERDGRLVGYLAHSHFNWAQGVTLVATAYEIIPHYPWAAVTPSVIRYLKAVGEAQAQAGGQEPFGAWGFWLGEEHPVYQVIKERLPRVRKPYAWYMRVADLPGFLRLVAPALEKRLEASTYAGHSGELKLTFYREGLRMVFEQGKLVSVEAWKPEPGNGSGDAAFPNLTFLQLLFGFRSIEELDYAFPDCIIGEAAWGLLGVLFPRKPSNVWGIT